MNAPPYRPEIDGLRAIAVISVLFYHTRLIGPLGIEASGGYVGVDIFFVISGYLIARLILTELQETGRLRIGAFYLRRARRILPALFFVMTACFPVGWLMLDPSSFFEFRLSALSALIFVSNLYFYGVTTDYGATASLTKPLLHTWSLGVEEQFYLLAPLAFLMWRKLPRNYGWGLALFLGIASLALAEATVRPNPAFAFFNPLSRAWELLIGVGVAAWEHRARGNSHRGTAADPIRWRVWLAIAGLIGILWSIVWFDGTTPHPGLVTLLPALSTAAVLIFCRPGDIVARLLSWNALRGCGRISFSLYLWHFPIFAFARLDGRMQDPLETVVLILITVLLSILAYLLIEQPFRHSNRIGSRAFLAIITLVVTTLIGAATGIQGRTVETSFTGTLQIERDNVSLRKESWKRARAKTDFADPASVPVLVVGNSHSKDTFNLLVLEPLAYPGFEFLNYQIHLACFDEANEDARPDREAFYSSEAYNKAAVIIVSTRYNADRTCVSSAYFDHRSSDFDGLEQFIERADRDGKALILFGPSVEFEPIGELTILDHMLAIAERGEGRTALELAGNAAAFANNVNQAYFARSHTPATAHRHVSTLAASRSIPFIDKRSIVCSSSNEACWGITPDGRKSFYDYGHYTIDGARLFAHQLLKQGFDRILRDVARK
ncbi:MAG: acyltransferase family protein [Pseudomonadota bacterium]